MVADYRKYLVFGLSFMLIVFVMAVGPLKQRGEAVTGHELYKGMCASCHGELGEGQAAGAIGNKAPALNNPQWLSVVSDQFLATTIREGRHGTSMAAFPATKLNDERMAELIGFMRHEFGNPNLKPEAVTFNNQNGDAARGKELYDGKCFVCHGIDGKGGPSGGLSLNNKGFIDSALKDPLYIYQVITKGKGGASLMVGQGLNEQEVADLLAFFKETWLPAAEQSQKKAEEDAAALAKAIKERSANLVVKPEAESGVAFIDGKSLVQDKCLACHRVGTEGNKGPGPDLTTVGSRLDLAAILKTLQEGHVGTAMVPANLTPEQTKVVADYLATLK